MAIDVPADLTEQLRRCADIDRIAPLMLKAAAPTAEAGLADHVRRTHSTAGRVVSKTYSVKSRGKKRPRVERYVQTGDLAASVKAEKVKHKGSAYSLKVGFAGNDSKGVSNELIANQLEYGNSRQPATPFIDAAKNELKPKTDEIMRRVFREEVSK